MYGFTLFSNILKKSEREQRNTQPDLKNTQKQRPTQKLINQIKNKTQNFY